MNSQSHTLALPPSLSLSLSLSLVSLNPFCSRSPRTYTAPTLHSTSDQPILPSIHRCSAAYLASVCPPYLSMLPTILSSLLSSYHLCHYPALRIYWNSIRSTAPGELSSALHKLGSLGLFCLLGWSWDSTWWSILFPWYKGQNFPLQYCYWLLPLLPLLLLLLTILLLLTTTTAADYTATTHYYHYYYCYLLYRCWLYR